MDISRESASKNRLPPGKPVVLVVGIGNPLRADDSVGLVIASEIAKRGLPLLRVAEHARDGASLMMLWEGVRTVILVDAVVSGAAAGTIYRLDLIHAPLPGWLREMSTHQLGLAEAVDLARVLNRLPERLVIYGVEGRIFEIGGRLSTEVKEAVPRAVEHVIEEARMAMLDRPRITVFR